jgi:hypothetical protein
MLTRRGISQRIRLLALALASALFGSLVTGTALEAAYQPNMVSARQSLRQALTYLNQATPDKGGHRANAINFTQQAITEVNRGIRYANNH